MNTVLAEAPQSSQPQTQHLDSLDTNIGSRALAFYPRTSPQQLWMKERLGAVSAIAAP